MNLERFLKHLEEEFFDASKQAGHYKEYVEFFKNPTKKEMKEAAKPADPDHHEDVSDNGEGLVRGVIVRKTKSIYIGSRGTLHSDLIDMINRKGVIKIKPEYLKERGYGWADYLDSLLEFLCIEVHTNEKSEYADPWKPWATPAYKHGGCWGNGGWGLTFELQVAGEETREVKVPDQKVGDEYASIVKKACPYLDPVFIKKGQIVESLSENYITKQGRAVW